MRVFVSWSGGPSHHLGRILHEWLPDIMQQVEPWLSSEDIGKGSRWNPELTSMLDDTKQGIICVTRDNMASPWLNFEAGALARSLQESKVRPVLLDLLPTDLTGPLSQFQVTEVRDKSDMLKLVRSINVDCARPLDDARLQRAFDHYWNGFVTRLATVPAAPVTTGARESSDVLREVLDVVRKTNRDVLDLVRRTDRRPAVPAQSRNVMPRWGEPAESTPEP